MQHQSLIYFTQVYLIKMPNTRMLPNSPHPSKISQKFSTLESSMWRSRLFGHRREAVMLKTTKKPKNQKVLRIKGLGLLPSQFGPLGLPLKPGVNTKREKRPSIWSLVADNTKV